MRRENDFDQLIPDALGTDRVNLRSPFRDGIPGGWINAESESCGKPHRPQQAQLILCKALGGDTDGAKNTCLQILTPSHEIENISPNWIVEESVHCEITSPCIPLGIGKGDTLRVPSIVIGSIAPEGGDLNLMDSLQHEDHTKLCPYGNCPRKECLDLLGTGIRRHIIVVGCESQHGVTDASAGIESLKPCGAQSLHNGAGGFFCVITHWKYRACCLILTARRKGMAGDQLFLAERLRRSASPRL